MSRYDLFLKEGGEKKINRGKKRARVCGALLAHNSPVRMAGVRIVSLRTVVEQRDKVSAPYPQIDPMSTFVSALGSLL